METTPLFRPDAVAGSRRARIGGIVIVRPLSLRVASLVCAAMAAALGALSYFGTYTAHRTLRGRLVTERSLIDVRSPQQGVVAERRVTEGQFVERGATLYVVSSERVSTVRGATQQAVGEKLDSRRRSLAEQVANTRALARMERAGIEQSVATLSAEAMTLGEAVAGQVARADVARQVADRYEQIRAQGFVSAEQMLGKRADLLEQQGRLRALEREQSGVARQLSDLDARAATADARYENEVSELERAIVDTDLQIAENEARRAIVILAPERGVVTGVAGDVGEPVDSSAPLAFIVPADSRLQAELFAPSRAAGFLAVGQEVLLRYEPYPYQKFGHYHGWVAAVSQTALAPAALRSPDGGALGAEPMYRVIVALRAQTVMAYGESRALRPGTAVEADVLLETRRLYEWVFEPLYSLAGVRG